MEKNLDAIEEQCRKQIQMYMRCVDENPDLWPTLCELEKKALNQCTSRNPLIKAINKECSDQFKKYNTCINENTDQLHVCLDVLESFNLCASKVAQQFAEKQEQTDKS